MAAAVVGGLRRPFFWMAVVAVILLVCCELGMSLLIGGSGGGVGADDAARYGVSSDLFAHTQPAASDPPGAGIAALALVDGLLAFTAILLGLGFLLTQRVSGRIQGAITLVVTLLWVLGGIVLAILALAKLLLMVGLFVAVPFGTIAYLAIWGFFPTGQAGIILALLLFLKLLFGVLLVIAQPRFLRIRGLVILFAVSGILELVLGLIHGILPGPVVAIGDQLWALVTIVVAVIWALIMLIGSIPAIVKAIRSMGAASDAA